MNTTRPFFLLGALAVLFAAQAAAQSLAGQTIRMLADENKDGRVTMTEYQNSRRILLMMADQNVDQEISRAEWKLRAQRLHNSLLPDSLDGGGRFNEAEWWTLIDADRNGRIEPEEIDIMTKARFGKFDTNHDGGIDAAEAAAGERALKAKLK